MSRRVLEGEGLDLGEDELHAVGFALGNETAGRLGPGAAKGEEDAFVVGADADGAGGPSGSGIR